MSAPAASASTGTRRCYHCKGTGHMAKDCAQAPQQTTKAAAAPAPAPAAAAAPAESSSSSSGTRKCYHCGQSGHMAKDCSQAPKKDGAARSSAPAAAAPRASSVKKDESSFKDRLAEYKAKIDPATGVKPLFCYLCGKEGHRERDCPKNSKKKDEEKACLRCGEEGHIARVCPTISNRTLYRDETKDRKAGCYICSEEGHHAEECPQLTVLSEEFAKFKTKVEGGIKLHAKVYNVLLEKCSKAMEINGALYLFDLMLSKGVTPTEDSYNSLEYLHDRSGKDQSKIDCIPMKPKRVAKLKEIVSSWKHERKVEQTAAEILPHIVAHLRLPSARTEAEACKSLFDLAKWLKGQSISGLEDPLSNISARTALTTLKALGRYHQASSKAEFDLDGALTNKGRFAKKAEAAGAASVKKSKKKKSKNSKKKKADGAKKGEEGSDDSSSEADDEEKKPKAAAAAAKKGSKRKGDDAAETNGEDEAQSKPASAASTKAAKKAKTAASVKESAASAAAASEPAAAARKKQKGAAGAVVKDEQPEAEAAAAAGQDKKKRKAKA